MCRDQLSDFAGRRSTGLDRGRNRGDVAPDHDRDQARLDVLAAHGSTLAAFTIASEASIAPPVHEFRSGQSLADFSMFAVFGFE
jgi:hypothetical protein